MRVLAVHPGPDFSVADVFTGWLGGLRQAGAQVIPFNLGDRISFYDNARFIGDDGTATKAVDRAGAVKLAAKGIEVACYELWPDVVLIVSGFYVPEPLYGLLRARGHKVVLLHTEEPYEADRGLSLASLADLNIVNDPTNLDRYRALAPTEFFGHCYDPQVHRRRPPSTDLASDFAFVGSGFANRIAFLEAVDWAGIDVALGGQWAALAPDSPLRKFLAHDDAECVTNSDTVDYLSSTKATANIYREPHGWAMGPREVEAAAIGCFMLRQSRGESDEVLGFLPTFDSPADFGGQLRYWLSRDDARQVLADRAREAVARRTFAASAARLLRLLDRP